MQPSTNKPADTDPIVSFGAAEYVLPSIAVPEASSEIIVSALPTLSIAGPSVERPAPAEAPAPQAPETSHALALSPKLLGALSRGESQSLEAAQQKFERAISKGEISDETATALAIVSVKHHCPPTTALSLYARTGSLGLVQTALEGARRFDIKPSEAIKEMTVLGRIERDGSDPQDRRLLRGLPDEIRLEISECWNELRSIYRQARAEARQHLGVNLGFNFERVLTFYSKIRDVEAVRKGLDAMTDIRLSRDERHESRPLLQRLLTLEANIDATGTFDIDPFELFYSTDDGPREPEEQDAHDLQRGIESEERDE